MRNIKIGQVTLAVLISIATLFALSTAGAGEKSHSSNGFQITVTDVLSDDHTIVKQIRIDAGPNSLARITSDEEGGGGVAASAGRVVDQPEGGAITVAVLADHIEWMPKNVNALKFLVSIRGTSKALMSDTGAMVTGKQLKDILSVSIESGTYEYGTAIPILKFKDRSFSLTVGSPAPER